jgi:hypothetical protein
MWIKLVYGRDSIPVVLVLLRTERYDEADWGSEGSDSEKNTGRNNSSAAGVEEVREGRHETGVTGFDENALSPEVSNLQRQCIILTRN